MSGSEELAAAQRDALRRLKDRDAAWADIDALRSALGLRLGEGLGLAEITACLRATSLTGDPVARAEQLSSRVRELEATVAVLTKDAEVREWVKEMCRLDNLGNIDGALDVLFDRVDALLWTSQFEVVDKLLTEGLEVERMTESLLVGVLTITRVAPLSALPGRVEFLARVEAEFRRRGRSPGETANILQGLR